MDKVAEALGKIRRFVDKAQQDSRCKVRFEEYPVPSRDRVEEWQEILREELDDDGYVIPGWVRKFYAQTGGFDLQWTIVGQDAAVAGSCRIASIFTLYQSEAEADTPMRECLKIARPLDVISPDEVVAVDLGEDGGDAPHLLFIDQQAQSAVPLSFAPEDYLVAAAEHLGIYGWQRGRQDAAGEDLARSVLED